MYGDLFLLDRVAIIAGASSEIGAAIACALANAGSAVVLGYYQHSERAENLANRLVTDNKKATVVQADLRIASDQHKLIVDSPIRAFGRAADILVHAVSSPDRTILADLNLTAINDALSLGPVSFLSCCQLFMDALHTKNGDIIAVASTAALTPYPRGHSYVAAQGALMATVRSLSLELAPRIRVNAILPGMVATAQHLKRQMDVEREEKIPLGRMIHPTEVAETALFLLHCRSIIGQGLVVDGGAGINTHK